MKNKNKRATNLCRISITNAKDIIISLDQNGVPDFKRINLNDINRFYAETSKGNRQSV